MNPDAEGFLYPDISAALCIDCGSCKSICAFNENYDRSFNISEIEIYAARHKEEAVRASSSSGGVFTALSDYIFSKGGVVYGALLDEDLYVKHSRADTTEARDRLRGSKYVQSDLMDTFNEAKADLLCQRYVLFTGTPCQTAGFRSYIKKAKIDSDRLFVCDFICHGTPSPLIWKEYICFVEKKRKKKISDFQFRSKIKGWGHTEVIVYDDGKVEYKSFLSQRQKRLYQRRPAFRPSCHKCHYTNFERPSDITIADFWGINNSIPDFFDKKGISLIIVNSAKGKDLFNGISNDIDHRVSTKTDCMQLNLKAPSAPFRKRTQFWDDYHSKGYPYVIRKYGEYSLLGYIKYILRSVLKTR